MSGKATLLMSFSSQAMAFVHFWDQRSTTTTWWTTDEPSHGRHSVGREEIYSAWLPLYIAGAEVVIDACMQNLRKIVSYNTFFQRRGFCMVVLSFCYWSSCCAECPEGTFSAGVSNGACETCPANSEVTGTGLTLCPCLQDYYRAPHEDPSLPCTR